MDELDDPLLRYAPVHAGRTEGAEHDVPAPIAATPAPSASYSAHEDPSLAGKIDQLLYETRTLSRTVDELKHEIEAMRLHRAHQG